MIRCGVLALSLRSRVIDGQHQLSLFSQLPLKPHLTPNWGRPVSNRLVHSRNPSPCLVTGKIFALMRTVSGPSEWLTTNLNLGGRLQWRSISLSSQTGGQTSQRPWQPTSSWVSLVSIKLLNTLSRRGMAASEIVAIPTWKWWRD